VVVTRTRLTAALMLGALVAAGSIPSVGADASYRVIVHPQVKGSQIPRTTLGSIFLKQAPRWGDGSPVQPVDQSMRSRIRQSFVADVLQQPMVEIQIFWNRKMAAGVTPPPVKQTDAEVVAFVAANPGAIGYISSANPVPDGVRELSIIQ
jgi:ABC-type phosphate transport system substrate-binding protein